MGKIKFSDEIQEIPAPAPLNSEPRQLTQAEIHRQEETPRNHESSVDAFPPISQPEEHVCKESSRKHEIVAASLPSSKPQELVSVSAYPPKSLPGLANGVKIVNAVQHVASLPPSTGLFDRVKDPKNGMKIVKAAQHVAPFDLIKDPTNLMQIVQPVQHDASLPPGDNWTTGLFDCMKDPTNALMTAVFPFATFGQIAEVLDAGARSCHWASAIYLLTNYIGFCSGMGGKYRRKLRKRFGIKQGPCSDVFLHTSCPMLALCQEFRELKNRGLDPNLGWKGILAQQQQLEMTKQQQLEMKNQQMNTPPPIQFMST